MVFFTSPPGEDRNRDPGGRARVVHRWTNYVVLEAVLEVVVDAVDEVDEPELLADEVSPDVDVDVEDESEELDESDFVAELLDVDDFESLESLR